MVEEEVPTQVLCAKPRDRVLLTVLAGERPGHLFHVEGRRAIVGRSPDAEIHLSDEGLSWEHACLRRIGDQFFIHDLGSTNGTFIDGERVHGLHLLKDGSRIGLGRTLVLRLTLQDDLEAQVSERLYEAVVRDGLTQAFNRQAFDERLTGELSFARRHGTPLAIIMMDIDNFKRVNDTRGHAAGDAVLREVVGTLLREIRQEDLLARFGGEEFTVIARGIGTVHGIAFAERMRRIVARCSVLHEGALIHVTASFGVASTEDRPAEAEALLAAADACLYAAKRAGRNRVVSTRGANGDTARPPAKS